MANNIQSTKGRRNSEANHGGIFHIVVGNEWNTSSADNRSAQNSHQHNESAVASELNEQVSSNPSDDSSSRVRKRLHQTVAILLLLASLSIGIYVCVELIRKFIAHKDDDLFPYKVVAHLLTCVVDVYGIGAVFRNHFYSVRDLPTYYSILHLILLFDYSQQFNLVRIIIELFAMITMISLSQILDRLHSVPLHPCSIAISSVLKYVKIILCTFNPCAEEDIDPTKDPSETGKKRRLLSFKLVTSAVILTSIGFSGYQFYSLSPLVYSETTSVFVIAIVANSTVAVYGFLAVLAESYRFLNGHFSISVSYVAIIISLAIRVSPSAWTLLVSTGSTALSIYTITCLLRHIMEIEDTEPYRSCKIFLTFWQGICLFYPPSMIAFTLWLSINDENLLPGLIFAVVVLSIFAVQCALLYATLAEKLLLIDRMVLLFIAVFFLGLAVEVFTIIYFKTGTEIMLFVLGYLWYLPICPFIKYYSYEIKLFRKLITEDDIWRVHKLIRKVFKVLSVSQTVGSVCAWKMK